jgi:hypothetical protein
MRATTAKKLGTLSGSPFVEPHESYTQVKPDATNVQKGGKTEPAGKALGHPHSNLGKFLHPKKGYSPSKGSPADSINNTVDANTGGHKVRPTQ